MEGLLIFLIKFIALQRFALDLMKHIDFPRFDCRNQRLDHVQVALVPAEAVFTSSSSQSSLE